MTETDTVSSPSWWGEFKLLAGQTGQWHIGSLSLSVQRLNTEWHICQINGSAALEELNTASVELNTQPLDEQTTCHRHVVKQSKKPLLVIPALADRPVVTRPLTPFLLHPGQEARLFVSTTIWLQVYAYSSGPLLLDIPTRRPSDSWFGPSTREGDVCYAARTHARLELADVPLRSFRAITPVKIANKGTEALTLERLLLPIPNLSVFAAKNGSLWTEELSIVCDEGMTSAHLNLAKGAPSMAAAAQRLAGPRTPLERGVLTRALGAIFG